MLILDAFNIIHAWGPTIGRSGRHAGVASLLSALSRGRYAGRHITLVCDGEAGRHDGEDGAAITRLVAGSSLRRVLYAGPHREADDLIEELIDAAPRPRSIVIVSSDRRLRSAAGHAGCSWLGATEFIAEIEADIAKAVRGDIDQRPSVDPGAVAWWLSYFGLAGPPPARVELPAPPGTPHDMPQPRGNVKQVDATAQPRSLDRLFPPGAIDPADLDMERWLRDGPRPPHR